MTEDLKNIIERITKDEERFYFNKYVVAPNSSGCFEHNGKWFFYLVDEKAYPSITGPFTPYGLVCALVIEYGTTDLTDDFKLSKDEKEVYYHNHYRSMDDVLKAYPVEKEDIQDE